MDQDQISPLPDTPPRESKYFYFCPAGFGDGTVVSTVLTGEVVVGSIHATNDPYTISILTSHQDWKPATKRAYDAQVKADSKEHTDGTE